MLLVLLHNFAKASSFAAFASAIGDAARSGARMPSIAGQRYGDEECVLALIFDGVSLRFRTAAARARSSLGLASVL